MVTRGTRRLEPLTGTAVSHPAIPPGLEPIMHGIIYLVGLIVIIMAILSFVGLH
jgi:hypothetical protein